MRYPFKLVMITPLIINLSILLYKKKSLQKKVHLIFFSFKKTSFLNVLFTPAYWGVGLGGRAHEKHVVVEQKRARDEPKKEKFLLENS